MIELKTHCALFAGLGGFILATEKLGIKTLFANDVDKNCIKTINTNFPSIYTDDTDIRELSLKKFLNDNEIDLMTAGFPCQSFSVAGDNLGFDDPRGKLFFEIGRLIRDLNHFPKVILLENVPNLKNYNSGERLAVIIRELRSMGYWVGQHNSLNLNTLKHAGSPQSRERLFIIALHSKSFKSNRITIESFEERTPRDLWKIVDRTERKSDYYYLNEENKYYQMLKKSILKNGKNHLYQVRRSIIRAVPQEGICPTLTANMGLGGHNVPFVSDNFGIRTLTISELLELQGFDSKVFTFPAISRGAKKTMIGNSVNPIMVEEILKKIISIKAVYGEKKYA